VFSTFDEFFMLMWDVPIAKDVAVSESLKTIFSVTRTVLEGNRDVRPPA
jgi:hypothetical protein